MDNREAMMEEAAAHGDGPAYSLAEAAEKVELESICDAKWHRTKAAYKLSMVDHELWWRWPERFLCTVDALDALDGVLTKAQYDDGYRGGLKVG